MSVYPTSQRTYGPKPTVSHQVGGDTPVMGWMNKSNITTIKTGATNPYIHSNQSNIPMTSMYKPASSLGMPASSSDGRSFSQPVSNLTSQAYRPSEPIPNFNQPKPYAPTTLTHDRSMNQAPVTSATVHRPGVSHSLTQSAPVANSSQMMYSPYQPHRQMQPNMARDSLPTIHRPLNNPFFQPVKGVPFVPPSRQQQLQHQPTRPQPLQYQSQQPRPHYPIQQQSRAEPTAPFPPSINRMIMNPIMPGAASSILQQHPFQASQVPPQPAVSSSFIPSAQLQSFPSPFQRLSSSSINSGRYFLRSCVSGTFLTLSQSIPPRLVHLDGANSENEIVAFDLQVLKEVKAELPQKAGMVTKLFQVTLMLDQAYIGFELVKSKTVNKPSNVKMRLCANAHPIDMVAFFKSNSPTLVSFKMPNEKYMSVRPDSGLITFGVTQIDRSETFELLSTNSIGCPLIANIEIKPNAIIPNTFKGWEWTKSGDEGWWQFRPLKWKYDNKPVARVEDRKGGLLPIMAILDYGREREVVLNEIVEAADLADEEKTSIAPLLASTKNLNALWLKDKQFQPHLIAPSSYGLSSPMDWSSSQFILPPSMKHIEVALQLPKKQMNECMTALLKTQQIHTDTESSKQLSTTAAQPDGEEGEKMSIIDLADESEDSTEKLSAEEKQAEEKSRDALITALDAWFRMCLPLDADLCPTPDMSNIKCSQLEDWLEMEHKMVNVRTFAAAFALNKFLGDANEFASTPVPPAAKKLKRNPSQPTNRKNIDIMMTD